MMPAAFVLGEQSKSFEDFTHEHIQCLERLIF